MNHNRQITLQGRLSAMFRVLPVVVASSMAFSLVFFSPVLDLKDSISASAQSRGDGGRGGGGGGSSSGGGSNSSGGGSGSSGGSGGSSSQGSSGSNSSGGSAVPGTSASQKPASGNLLKGIFKRQEPTFNGNSEPSGGMLSKREEREAIDNGWQ
ncbi:hypothetical protein [Roseibium aggregatum]|uniref:Uncharacterized protein n=1 Tax=Roseibium aggregatum TaxID=187304 RepID=A0A939EIC0_9HYPH|nr:hypothetical protein [Roseibium aggregatum]MBN9673221.1 hypothetical protein [Roseibium aggregatum]